MKEFRLYALLISVGTVCGSLPASSTTMLTASDGIVYMMSQREQTQHGNTTVIWSIKALRETDGRLLWATQPNQPIGFAVGNYSTTNVILVLGDPPFSGGVLGHTLYLLPNTQHPSVEAFDTQTGALLWQRSLPASLGVNTTLLATGSHLYFGKLTQVCQTASSSCYQSALCQAATTGAIQRCYQTPALSALNTVVTNDTLYVPIPGASAPTITIAAIRASDGQRLWLWDVPRAYGLPAGQVFQGSIATSGVVGVVTAVAVYGLRASNGYRFWSWSPPGNLNNPASNSSDIITAAAG